MAPVFLLDPRTRQAFRCTPEGMFQVPDLRTADPEILVPPAEVFEV